MEFQQNHFHLVAFWPYCPYSVFSLFLFIYLAFLRRKMSLATAFTFQLVAHATKTMEVNKRLETLLQYE